MEINPVYHPSALPHPLPEDNPEHVYEYIPEEIEGTGKSPTRTASVEGEYASPCAHYAVCGIPRVVPVSPYMSVPCLSPDTNVPHPSEECMTMEENVLYN